MAATHSSSRIEMLGCSGAYRTRTVLRILRQSYRSLDLIKIYFDFRNAFCVSIEFGSYAARNMFP